MSLKIIEKMMRKFHNEERVSRWFRDGFATVDLLVIVTISVLIGLSARNSSLDRLAPNSS